jgi:lysophospholipase L1-like esterase
MLKRFNKTVQIPAELECEYAAAALRVMRKHGVAVNDLHALMAPDLGRYQIAPDNVHYNAEGTKLQARQVATKILEALDARKP